MPDKPAGPDALQSLDQLKALTDREVLVTLHPSALLRVDSEDREAAIEAFVANLRQAQRCFGR
jgi:hypothetical protein